MTAKKPHHVEHKKAAPEEDAHAILSAVDEIIAAADALVAQPNMSQDDPGVVRYLEARAKLK